MVRYHKHEGIHHCTGYLWSHSVNRKHRKKETNSAHKEEIKKHNSLHY